MAVGDAGVAAPSRSRTRGGPVAAPLAGLSDEEIAAFEALQARIGVRFRRLELLREAMTHASWNNERGEPSGPGRDNERLEYLGDAVLELVVGEYLFRRFPGYDEGQLTQLRAALVNTVSLARLGERLQLGETLLLGRGAAKTGARKLPSLLANAFEAMTGAIFLDQGYRVATRVFVQNIGDLADWTDDNHKGRLQEVAQERTGSPPQYRVVAAASGTQRVYAAEAMVGGEVLGTGRGGTKQAAEQAAAHAALERLRRAPANAAARAAGAAREAAKGAATESARVRRRVAEVAAEGGASAGSRRDRPRQAAAGKATPAPPAPRRGLLAALRAAAEAIVGNRRDEPPPAPEPAPRKRTRRGHRGGRNRSGRTGAPPP